MHYCKQPAYSWPVILLVIMAGCGESVDPETLSPGQEAYLQHCASCHGNAGEGKPPAFPPLAGSEWLELGAEALALIALNGLRGEIEVSGRTYRGFMPPMRHIGDEELASLLAYIEGAWTDRVPVLDSTDISELRRDRLTPQPLYGREGVIAALEGS